MANKVISYHPQPHGDYQLGFCTVDMGGKYRFIIKVLKSKLGNVYCAFNSVKIGETWMSDFSFGDKDGERIFLNSCLEQLKPMMGPQKQSPEPKQHQDESSSFQDPNTGFSF